MPFFTPADEDGVLVDKLKRAFGTYESASKKYLSAVKDLDFAMEQIAIAFRELSQGELNETTKAKCDALCDAIDEHKCGTASGSKMKRLSKDGSSLQTPGEGNEEEYYFSIYMSDMAREVSAPLDALRAEVKQLAKLKDQKDEVVKKYDKSRQAVDELETKLAKKNQSVTDNTDYNQKVAKRDQRKALKETEEARFDAAYKTLLNRRSEIVNKMISSMTRLSSMYYQGLAKMLQPSD